MKSKARFIKSVIASVDTNDVQLPWTRGTRRAEMIARRTQPSVPLRSKSA